MLLQRFREHAHPGFHELFKPPLGHTYLCLLRFVSPHSTIVHVLQDSVTTQPSEKNNGTARPRSERSLQNAGVHWRAQCVATLLYSPPCSGPLSYLGTQSLRCDGARIDKHTSSTCCQRQPLRTLKVSRTHSFLASWAAEKLAESYTSAQSGSV